MMSEPTLDSILAKRSLSRSDLDVEFREEHITKLALEITNWKTLAPFIGLTRSDEEDIEEENRRNQQRKIALLRKWKERFCSHATYLKLAEAFETLKWRDKIHKLLDLPLPPVGQSYASIAATPEVTNGEGLNEQAATVLSHPTQETSPPLDDSQPPYLVDQAIQQITATGVPSESQEQVLGHPTAETSPPEDDTQPADLRNQAIQATDVPPDSQEQVLSHPTTESSPPEDPSVLQSTSNDLTVTKASEDVSTQVEVPGSVKVSNPEKCNENEDEEDTEFVKWLLSIKVRKRDREILKENGINYESFKCLKSTDFKEMNLSIGARRTLEQQLQVLNQQSGTAVDNPPDQEATDNPPDKEPTVEVPRSQEQKGTRRASDYSSIPGETDMPSPTQASDELTERDAEHASDSDQPHAEKEAQIPTAQALVPNQEKDSFSLEPYIRKVVNSRWFSRSGKSMQYKPKLKLDDDPANVKTIDSKELEKPTSSIVEFYRMKSNPHGVCLIINNEKFVADKHRRREGTDRDEENLIETFRYLGYRVEVRRECTKLEMECIFDTIDKLVDEKHDSFICCILSHGNKDIVYGSDSEPVFVRTEQDSLEMRLIKCQKLHGKPKIFFVSTCRGTVKREGVPKPRWQSDGEVISARTDFVFNFATLPGELSWRDTYTGTFYINTLCNVLCQYATNTTLEDIQKKVTQEITDVRNIELKGKTFVQTPASEQQTTKHIYLFDDMI